MDRLEKNKGINVQTLLLFVSSCCHLLVTYLVCDLQCSLKAKIGLNVTT